MENEERFTLKLVLLSGGSGKRLWPMSNDIRSKQFLRVLPREASDPESMLQRVWRQLEQTGIQRDTFVCASRAQTEVIKAQIGQVHVIEEPSRRDTFAAIALSVLYLMDQAQVDADEPIAICPVDHYVEDHYFQDIQKLSEVLLASNAELALMGVEPTVPTNKFGYIVPEGSQRDGALLHVQRFVEKPDVPVAEQLIRDGALWNCGVFCFRAGTLRDYLKARGLPTRFVDAEESFDAFPKRSFDYEFVERAKHIVVHPYRGTWNDLGTWSALADHMAATSIGAAIDYQCENTHVVNELGIPVVTMGLKDAVVVATPDGILAADKTLSSFLKDVVSPLQNRPMFEERSWGTYRVLDYQKLSDGTEVLTKSITLQPGKYISYQQHLLRSEIWTVIEGCGEVILGNERFDVAQGDVVRVDAEAWHSIRTTHGMQFIEVQRGQELIEEDIVRKPSVWAE